MSIISDDELPYGEECGSCGELADECDCGLDIEAGEPYESEAEDFERRAGFPIEDTF